MRLRLKPPNTSFYDQVTAAAVNLVEGAHLLDMAPTLLELGGYDRPPSFQGRSLVAGEAVAAFAGYSADEEETVRDRLSGLGYLG